MKHLLLLSLFFSLSFAKSVTASFTYTIGDRDTKIEAKKIAFAEAKRMAIENIGVWIKSETNIVDGKLASDEINSFVTGYAKTRIISESFEYPKYTVTIELTIDEEELKRNIPQEKKEKSEKVIDITQKEEKLPLPEERLKGDSPEKSSFSEILPDLVFKNFEVGIIFGSGSVNIEDSSSASSQTQESSEKMGYAGIKALYKFTENHAIQFIGGGGSSELENETLRIDTSSLAYVYHFEPMNSNQVIPFLGIGIASGKAIYTDSADKETAYSGTGAILQGGFKWIVSKDGAHMIEAGYMMQSFSDEETDALGVTTEKKFSLSDLSFGYAYRF